MTSVWSSRERAIPRQLYLTGFDRPKVRSLYEIHPDPNLEARTRRSSAHWRAVAICQNLQTKAHGGSALKFFTENPEKWYFANARHLGAEARELFVEILLRTKLQPALKKSEHRIANLRAISMAELKIRDGASRLMSLT
jgi:hypothetical protein